MYFFCKTFNHSISPIYQQITIMKMEYIEKKLQKNAINSFTAHLFWGAS